ncbi:MAG: biotin--[acetyl-CoA-carboxylase] ligase [Rikenellaceae bacterium]|nr:biotin--[acetyl-CoA-carboxylase] ligase [Rikenellaceae bacterium]
MLDKKERIHRIATAYSIRIEYYQRLTSTNDQATRPGRKQGDVIWAEDQTRGRGQRGNYWHSEPGKNLTFSMVLFPEGMLAEEQFYLSKLVSVALIESLAEYGIQAEIKWPNDIYIADQKVAGILIENDLLGACITRSILGVGLNVNQTEFDPVLPNPVSLRMVSGRTVDRLELLQDIIVRVLHGYQQWDRGVRERIDAAYDRSLYRRKGTHPFREPEGPVFWASIETVLPSGELVLLRDSGVKKSYLFKEVEFMVGETPGSPTAPDASE